MPEDRRQVEVGAGLSVVVGVGGAVGYEAVAPLLDADTTAASLLLGLVGVLSVLDLTQRKPMPITGHASTRAIWPSGAAVG